VRKGRRISRFSLAGRPFSAQAAELGQKPQCAVELTEVRTSDRDRWALGFEATGPDDLLRRALQATAALVFALRDTGRAGLQHLHGGQVGSWCLGLGCSDVCVSAVDHQTFMPPSTTTSMPVMYELSSEERNRATFATSSG
jgi:hypothetical protein